MDSLEFFSIHPVFTHKEYLAARQVVDKRNPRTADSLLRQHQEKGRIVRVRRGLYATVPPGTDKIGLHVDPYLLATKVSDDATVAYHAALQFHGRTYSMWSRLTFLSRKNIRPFSFGGTDFVPVKPCRTVADKPEMGGGVKLEPHAGGRVRVTTCERAMVDVLNAPNLAGGWEEIWRSLEMVEFFDLDAAIAYTLQLKSALTASRVGFYLEQHRDNLFVEDGHLETLAMHAPKQKRYFDRSRTSGRLVHRWNLIVPEQIIDRSWQEVL